jgi:Mrp family chromosome partitioning ATPase/capsular polysaccharide biosynthesis protein
MRPHGTEESMGETWAPVGLLRAIWRYRWMVAAITVIAALAGFFGSALLPTRYEATSRMQLADPEQGGVFGEMEEGVESEPYLLDEAQRVTSTPVLERAARVLNPSPTLARLRDQVRGSAVVELNSIRVTAEAPTGERAANIANAVSVEYQKESSEQRHERARIATDELQAYMDEVNQELKAADVELERLRTDALRQAEATSPVLLDDIARSTAAAQILAANVEYQTLLLERQAILTQLRSAMQKAERIRIDAEVVGSGVRRFDRAEVPAAPAQPQRNLLAVVAGLLGFLGATGLAWRMAEDRAAAERSEDAASLVGVPLLGEVPPYRSPANVAGVTVRGAMTRARIIAAPYSTAGESFQYTLSSLLATLPTEGRTPVVVVAGTLRGDGGTTTALNLGFAASQRQMRAAVIDADFRQRGLTRVCGLSADAGVSESDGRVLRAYDIAHEGRLQVVPTGNAFGDAIAYLNSGSFARAVETARLAHDLVVLDAPPVLTAADALSAAEVADGIVLVVGLGRTFDDLREAARVLGRAQAPLIGYVFNEPRRRWFRWLRKSH